ncbi:hypothetical protein BsWGS_00688 [Bradybaena similaris]
MRGKAPVRQISTTRRLLSEHWQQEGIPGANLPFSLENKYKLTLLMTVYFASGLNAPFIILVITFKRMYAPQVNLGSQVLTQVICFDSAEE